VVADADTHLHQQAIKFLVARLARSPLLAAVAGAPHVTNRNNLLCAMQVLEAASVIGVIRRTQSLTGRVGIVAGVVGPFRRDRVRAVGGYDGRMATEDIDLTWKLLLDGWQTAYEPRRWSECRFLQISAWPSSRCGRARSQLRWCPPGSAVRPGKPQRPSPHAQGRRLAGLLLSGRSRCVPLQVLIAPGLVSAQITHTASAIPTIDQSG
jgi:hypothetical protein